MKINRAITLFLWPLVAALFVSLTPPAAGAEEVKRVLMKTGKLFLLAGGLRLPVTNELTLTTGITVLTNGSFRVENGKERPLRDGQVLGSDGMLLSPDGTVKPVRDHIALLNGRPVIMKDGEESPLTDIFVLPDGRQITPDGYLAKTSGEKTKLLDGETLALNGNPIPAVDTITSLNGKVIVQKDGGSFEVPPGRSLMMNDGTKVFGDGTILMKDGTRKDLVPNEIVQVEGVTPHSR